LHHKNIAAIVALHPHHYRGGAVATYKLTFSLKGNTDATYVKAESEGEAGELFDTWADGLDDYAELLLIEEVKHESRFSKNK
jgi:hypothetical protein